MAEEKKDGAKMDSKEMLKKAGKSNRKIKFGTRMKLIVIKDGKFHKKGQIIEPHTVMGEQLVSDKIAASYSDELLEKVQGELEEAATKAKK